MPQYGNILGAVGRTPLIRLNRIAADVPSPIYAKAEFLNPGGSVKDRIGLAMIEAAEREGLLKPGSTIIEATAGNTGVGLAQAAAIKGYRLIVVMPDKMSQDKIGLLRAYGAEVVITATNVPPDSPESYNGVADRLAREIPGSFRPNQFAQSEQPADSLPDHRPGNLGGFERAGRRVRRRNGDGRDDLGNRQVPQGAKPEPRGCRGRPGGFDPLGRQPALV